MGIGAATIAICLSTWGITPRGPDLEETVDVIEINHLHDDQGRPIFDQILFYEWSPAQSRYQLRDWRLLKSLNQIPLASARDGEYVAIWNDPKAGDTLRSTRAKIVRESWTHFDPELVEREFLAENLRRKLKPVPTQRKNAAAAALPAIAASPTVAAGEATLEPPRAAPAPLRPLQAPVRATSAERP